MIETYKSNFMKYTSNKTEKIKVSGSNAMLSRHDLLYQQTSRFVNCYLETYKQG